MNRKARTMKEDIASALRSLTPSTETAKLREIFSEVDAALKAGVSRESVWSALKERGFTFTLNSFNSAVTRLRKEKVKLPQGNEPKQQTEDTAKNQSAVKSTDKGVQHKPPEVTEIESPALDDVLNPQKRDQLYGKYGRASSLNRDKGNKQ